MKILVPMSSREKTDNISGIFGRSPIFAIYDTDTEELSFVDNPSIDRAGGAGITAGQFAINFEIDKVIVTKIGPRARDVLAREEIEIEELGDNNQTLEEIIDGL